VLLWHGLLRAAGVAERVLRRPLLREAAGLLLLLLLLLQLLHLLLEPAVAGGVEGVGVEWSRRRPVAVRLKWSSVILRLRLRRRQRVLDSVWILVRLLRPVHVLRVTSW